MPGPTGLNQTKRKSKVYQSKRVAREAKQLVQGEQQQDGGDMMPQKDMFDWSQG